MNDFEYEEYFLQEKIGICKPKKWIIQGLLKQGYELDRIRINDEEDIQSLVENYIVWYRINERGSSGWDIPNSMHYTIGGFIEDLPHLRELTNHEHEITGLDQIRESLMAGLTSNITIRMAYDTTLNTKIIVDGTKRAVSLCTLLSEDSSIISSLLTSDYRIEILYLTSKYCHVVFPCDFSKFY